MGLMPLQFNILVFSTGNEEVPGQKGCLTGSETEGSLHRDKGQSYGGTNLQVSTKSLPKQDFLKTNFIYRRKEYMI